MATLSLSTLIGRAWSDVLPARYRAGARFYLSPVLGLATLVVLASLVGRHFPLGTAFVAPGLALVLLVAALVRETKRWQAIGHALLIGVFGLICGVSLLRPLMAYGTINPHNDTFTYLAQSAWLQQHAFADLIAPEQITPLTSQIALYQSEGLRMGASFLLALMQAMFVQRWPYEIYPAAMIVSVAACCLAIGFGLSRVLRPLRRLSRYALLSLPAFSLGGLVFGSSFGFLPQIVGLACATGLLSLLGPLLRWVATQPRALTATILAALPCALLFSALAFAYSELLPFVTIAVLLSAMLIAVYQRGWMRLISFGAMLACFATLILNAELLRAFAALHGQAVAVVGGPVAWPLIGFIAHALGVHGGVWDTMQWSLARSWHTRGELFLGVIVVVLIAGGGGIRRCVRRGDIVPMAMMLPIFFVALLYFRYAIPSPFPIGKGNSWSEFKLADWAHPFTMVLVVLAIADLRSRAARKFEVALALIFVAGFVSAASTGVRRVEPLIEYYGPTRNLDAYFLQFRKTVLNTCGPSAPIYLALNGDDVKFRQLAVVYLYDRDVRSDWDGDDYIGPYLATDHRNQELSVGDCVVERLGATNMVRQPQSIGRFGVGTLDWRGTSRITGVSGAYPAESDGSNWWRWVAHRVDFKFQNQFVSADAAQTRVHFSYASMLPQNLTVRVIRSDGASQQFVVHSQKHLSNFDETIDWPASKLVEMDIVTDGDAVQMNAGDSRVVAWQVRNVSVTPQRREK